MTPAESPRRPVIEPTRDNGFTLVETMVVVIVVGILASIALPSFLGLRTTARDRAAQAYLTTAEKVLGVVGLENEGFPSNATLLAQLPAIEPSIEWQDHLVDSTDPQEISLDQDAGGAELALAARSLSGTCFYLRLSTSGPSVRHSDAGAAQCVAHDFQDGAGAGW